FANGIAWGEAKKQLFELVNEELREPRQRYTELMADRGFLESTLQQGASKARAVAAPLLQRVKQAIGLRPMSAQ
ncbi:MAG: tryptophan--tRNA ligase, partial [Gammaproteobacteria bacterium]|nr:tryptophan--tRNA ligase [Gammaproteobacteria bacterium]